MPLTRIFAPKHLAFARLKSLAEAVQDGLGSTCNVPPKDRFQLIARFESEEMILDSDFGGVSRSPDACIVEFFSCWGKQTISGGYFATLLTVRLPQVFVRTTS